MAGPGFSSPPSVDTGARNKIGDKAGGRGQQGGGDGGTTPTRQQRGCPGEDKLSPMLGNMLICHFHFLNFHNPGANLELNINCAL